MKRKGNLFNKIIKIQNLDIAHYNARKGKSTHRAVMEVDCHLKNRILDINQMLISNTYKVSEYKIEKRLEHKKIREIYKLPYFPDRIIHHSLLQIVQPILEQTYIKDTYQSIKGRGIHKAKDRVDLFMMDKENTEYCLKIDIKKFYASVDNGILKKLVRKKIKCKETLNLMDIIIDSTKGLPIGNYTSQTFGNFYLSYFDHFVKEKLGVKYYIRYADDMIFFSKDKEVLHKWLVEIEKYLSEELNLKLKENYQVFNTREKGLDFLGFRFFDGYKLLRKAIVKNFKSVIKKIIKCKTTRLSHIQSLMSFYGWIKSGNGYNLLRYYLSVEVFRKIALYYAKIKTKNPLRNINIVPKPNINSYGNYQPTLF